MPKVTIDVDEDVLRIIKKRADKNLLTTREQVEDIVRRSCVNYKTGSNYSKIKVDDSLVDIFSREKRGKSRKKKKKR